MPRLARCLRRRPASRNNPAMQARANGLTAGSFTRRGLETFTIGSLSRPRAVAGSAAILSGLATLTRRGTRVCAVPSEPALTLAPQAMQLALRRLRLPLLAAPAPAVGICEQQVDEYGDHTLACLRTGLLARRAKIVERAGCA